MDLAVLVFVILWQHTTRVVTKTHKNTDEIIIEEGRVVFTINDDGKEYCNAFGDYDCVNFTYILFGHWHIWLVASSVLGMLCMKWKSTMAEHVFTKDRQSI